MEIVGYCIIKRKTTTGMSAVDISKFEGKTCRVFEFGDDCVLIIDSEATGIASFDMCDVETSFKCSQSGMVVCPPDLSEIQKMLYAGTCTTRKGGYNHIVQQLVITASLHKGKFTDSILWQVQNDEYINSKSL